jgi:hypothetical protein
MSEGMVKPLILLVGTVIGGFATVLGGVVLLAHRVADASEPAHVSISGSSGPLPATAAPAPMSATALMDQRFKAQVQPFLAAHCYKCHANGKHKGDVTLDKFTSFASVQADRKTWQDVHDELEQHEMPPKKEPAPPADQLAMVLGFVSDSLNFSDPSTPRDPGFVPIHRLNRNEYNNTIRDLVGVDFHPADDFPADDTGYGFDNIADVLSMSPLLMEKYLTAAEQVMDKAIVTDNPNKPRRTEYVAAKMTGGELLPGGHRILTSEGQITQEHMFPAAADYDFKVEAEGDQAGNEPARMTVKVAGQTIRTFDVRNRRGHSKVFSFHAHVAAGTQPVVMEFINDFYDPTAKDPKRRDRNLIVDSLEINGPLDLPPPPPTDTEKRLLFCGPANGPAGEAYAGQIIRSFTTRAFRRPVNDDEINRLMRLYRMSRARDESFQQACKFALTAVLVSPNFLYRIEQDPADHPQLAHPLNDYELASRLSYFLWSSIPDAQLLDLAGKNKLHEPATLDAQVKRMLADSRSSQFFSNFAGQWLELRNLSRANPDPKEFPQFPELRDDMRREGELFFENIVRDDRSVLDLLDAKYSFLNERLAKFYGIDGVTGDEFRKVEFNDDQARRRGGVLTMAAVMTVTALPNRTSPVKRGKFILDQILGTPPPPPPPDVPALSDKQTDVAGASVRQRMEAHRENPSCASCHARMDPLGFSLENYDAIGRWRERDGKFSIDASAVLPSGDKFNGPDGLRQMLLKHKDLFLRNLVQKLMTYSLGRGTDYYDVPTVNDICRSAEQKNYRFSSLIDGIVHSDAFLKRRGKTE